MEVHMFTNKLTNSDNETDVAGTGAEYSGEADLLEYTVGDIAIDNLSNNTESDYGEVMVGAIIYWF